MLDSGGSDYTARPAGPSAPYCGREKEREGGGGREKVKEREEEGGEEGGRGR